MDPAYEKTLTTPSDAGPQFRPAKGILVVLGVFVIFGGVVLLALGWLAGIKLPNLMADTPGMKDSPLSGVFAIYRSIGVSMALMAIGFIILGIGSITLRKWAQKLLLAWGWMLVGFCGIMVIGMVVMVPSMMNMMNNMGGIAGGTTPTPAGASFSMIMIVTLIIQILFYIVIIGGPGALLIVIYRRKNVELTTRYYHQAPCWTDQKPIPVLVLWLFYILGILTMIPMFFGYIEAAVDLGFISSIKIGNIAVTIFIVVLTLLAFGVARLARWSWWGSIVYLLACGGLGYYMYSTFDWADFNEKIYSMSAVEGEDVSESLKEMQESMPDYQKQSMQAGILSSGLVWMGLMGYLFWIRKHFSIKNEKTLEVTEA